MHLKRWITGLLALPLLIYMIHAGGLWLTILVASASLAALLEYDRIAYHAWQTALPGPIPVVGLLTIPALCGAAHVGRPDLMLAVLLVHFLLAGMLSLFFFGRDTRVLEIVQKQIQGVLYIPLLLSLLILIRQVPDGFLWIFTLVLAVFAGDTLAFYTGTFLGRHKLCPSISPGKTIEGSMGGLGANILAAVIMKPFFPPDVSWTQILLFCLLSGVAAQMGDLFESQMKRVSGIKDSGGLLPGHGGMLDRIDALLFATPVAYLLLRVF
ncbi:MAG: phosphatidate cytidylyltransferase [Desulfobacterales bacterium]|nr:phosphatidate cytidylyltransferase [Desulfobacterales bacterium]